MNKRIDPTVLDKLRKMMSLAGDSASHQGEVEAAMAKAKELATRHNLDLSSLDLSTDEKVKAAIDIEHNDSTTIRSKYEQIYHRYIYNLIGQLFNVSIVRTTTHEYNGVRIGKIHMIGDPFDVAIATVVFPYLEKIFPKILSGFVSKKMLTYSAADTRGCYSGIVRGILDMNLREEAKIVKPSGYALVVRNKEALITQRTKEIFPDMKQPKARACHNNPLAWMLGFQEGQKINLRQMGAGKAASALK
jgi:hypothetical protein